MKDVTMKDVLNAQVKLHKDVEALKGISNVDNSNSIKAMEVLGLTSDDLDSKSVVHTNFNGTLIDRSASAKALEILGEKPIDSSINIRKKSINELIDEAPEATIFDLTTPEHLLACYETINDIRESQTERMSDADAWVASFAGLLGGVVELFVGGAEVSSSLEKSGLDTQGIKKLEANHSVSYDAANSGHVKMDWKDLSGSDKKLFSSVDKENLGDLTREYKKAFSHNKDLYEKGAFNNLNCKGHHFDSPAHDVLGGVYAVKDQIEGKCTIYSPSLGEMVTVIKPGSGMEGGYTVENVLKAAMNFFGHILSDVNGSGSTAGGGAGIGFPGCSVLMNDIGIKSGATDMAREAYLQGYDFREFLSQGLAVAIPKIILWVWKKISGISDIIYNRMCAIAYGVVSAVSIAKAVYLGDSRLNYMAMFLFAQSTITDIIYWMRLEEKRKVAVHNHIMEAIHSSEKIPVELLSSGAPFSPKPV